MYKNKEWLQEQIDKYGSIKEISKNTNYSETSLKRWCDKYDLKPINKIQPSNRITKEFLISQYEQGKTIREIAKDIGSSTATILIKNKEHGVSPRDYAKTYKYHDKEWLKEQFSKYQTVSKVAEKTGYPRVSISRYAEKFGIYESKFTREAKNHVNESYFEYIDTPQKAYFLGFIMADGNIYQYNNGRFQFSIKLKHDDINILEKFANEIQFDKNKIKTVYRERKGTVTKSAELKICNPVFCNYLVNWGIVPRKTGKEKVPENLDKTFYKDFIRGFIDGDGSIKCEINKRKYIQYCSTSKEIIECITEYLSEITDTSTVNVYEYKGVHSICFNKAKVVYQIANHIYYEGCVALDRKYIAAREIVKDYLY